MVLPARLRKAPSRETTCVDDEPRPEPQGASECILKVNPALSSNEFATAFDRSPVPSYLIPSPKSPRDSYPSSQLIILYWVPVVGIKEQYANLSMVVLRTAPP